MSPDLSSPDPSSPDIASPDPSSPEIASPDMASPDLSIVIPARDAAETLPATLRSIGRVEALREVVVVDDGGNEIGSTLAAVGDLPLRVLEGERRGAAAARNVGIRATTSDLICCLDADDEWAAPSPEPRLAEVRSGAEIALGLVLPVDAQGVALAPPFRSFLTGTAIVRHGAYEAVGMFDEDLPRGEDVEWFMRAQDAGLPMAWVPDVVLRYRLRAGTLSSRRVDRADGLLAALRTTVQRRSGGVR
jgi:glycosyltransferase involved in cell wall biosynthesis